MNKKIKVAYSNRIIPHFRAPVFSNLSKRDKIDLTVFYGKGLKKGSQSNDTKIFDFKSKKLFTIPFVFKRGDAIQFRSWHPTLLFHLIFGKFDLVITEPSTNLLNNFSVFLYCKLLGKKIIWYEAGVAKDRFKSFKRRIVEKFISIFIKSSDAYITYNSFSDNYLKENYRINEKKIFRAQNTIDTSSVEKDIKRFKPIIKKTKTSFGLTNKKVITFIGGIERRKKISNLINAVNEFNNIHTKTPATCLVVGDGPDLKFFKKNFSCNDFPVIYAGQRISDAVLMILISDLIVLPGEGGLAINHSFACGKPFVGTKDCVSGDTSIFDYVKNGYNGYVAKKNNIQDLVKKIELVFKNYESLCRGATESSSRHSIPKLVDGIVDSINFVMRN